MEESNSINQSPRDSSPLLRSEGRPNNASPKKKEKTKPDEKRVRQPVNYHSINNSDHDDSTRAVIGRYKYYSRLAPHGRNSFQMPDHVVPSYFFNVTFVPVKGKQNSIITIFSLWNTMMGTSILSMPWAIEQAGFITGIALLVIMAGIMLYTSYRILVAVQGMDVQSEALDFSDVCQHYLGRWAQILAIGSSLLTLLGGAIVYWILMSNFLYNIVTFIYHRVDHVGTNTTSTEDYVCPNFKFNHTEWGMNNFSLASDDGPLLTSTKTHSHDATLDKVWKESLTVPFFLILVLGPIINFKSPTFFTKFNALGTVSVTYLVTFVAINAGKWGINLDFSAPSSSLHYIPNFKGTFVALTGVAALAYFVQNCVISIVRNQKHPENNVRDLIIAYILVAVTYIYMGAMFYAAFPFPKNCIEDNLLNNMADTNVLAFIARIGLFFQMMCVFPLLLYIFRVQFLFSVFGAIWPSLKHVLGLNLVIVAVCVTFAIFVPHIGKIIGFVGAFCGLSYAIALPCMVYLKMRHEAGTLTYPIIIIHSFLILIGLANFVGQFIILGES